jgi:hypothetical protein
MLFQMPTFSSIKMFLLIVLMVIVMLSTLVFGQDTRHSTIHIMVLFSTQGSYANVSDYRTVFPRWQQYVNDKYITDKSWPFNISLEHTDVQSNISFINSVMEKRLSSTTLPGIIISLLMFDCRTALFTYAERPDTDLSV